MLLVCPKFNFFYVGKPTVLSDHCCISMRIKTKFVPSGPPHTPNVNLSKAPEKFIWNPSVSGTFVALLSAPETPKELASFRDTEIHPTQQGINTAVDQLTSIVNNVASKTMCQSNRGNRFKGKKRNPPHKRWFTKDCRITKNRLSRLASRMKKYPFDRDLQSRYRSPYYEYKTMIRKAARSYDSDLKNKLLTVEKSDPRGFWRLISKIKKEHENDNEDMFAQDFSKSAKKYYDYFTQLYTHTENRTDCDASVFKSYLKPAHREDNIMQLLNAPFKEEEVIRGILKLKPGKSPGLDKILNEFLKSGREMLSTVITMLFNKILQSGKYPEQWSVNVLSTIHKGGCKNDLDNYRGISVSSCFGKLYGSLLSCRLEETITKFGLIGPHQIGFLKGHRTADHIFVVNSLINKIVKKDGKSIYGAFIDLRKAYDSVDRSFLFNKLWSFGFEGNFLQSIRAMYQSVYQRVKIKNMLLDPIIATRGLKQGCHLSPLLFNLFIEDINQQFGEICDQVNVDGMNFSHLLYADDLLLLSTTPSGLQTCLDRIESYFSKWNLEVNLKKSNVVVFNRTGKISHDMTFHLTNQNLDLTNRYKYLGTLMSSTGSYSPAIENLCEKTSKAYFAVRNVLKKVDFDTNITLKIFDSVLQPILTYNSEIWSQLNSRQLKVLKKLNDQDERTKFIFESLFRDSEAQYLKICKSVLGVNRSCSNLAVLGELGRSPVVTHCLEKQFLFFHRLINMPGDNLVKRAFNDSCHLQKNDHFSWVNSCCLYLKAVGIDSNPNRLKNMRPKQFKALVRRSLRNSFVRYWTDGIKSKFGQSKKGGNKLRTYATFKGPFKRESYTKLTDKSLRRCFAKFRCSDHRLRIEVGRRENLQVEDRTCLMCNENIVEDEQHFLTACPKYHSLRTEMYEKIEKSVKNFKLLTPKQKFIYLMSCENLQIIRWVACYIKHASEIRSDSSVNSTWPG